LFFSRTPWFMTPVSSNCYLLMRLSCSAPPSMTAAPHRAAADPNYSEGGVGHDYLMRRGIPETALIAETQASDTSESAQRVAVIMRANRMGNCIAVSDAYHVFRIRKMLEHEGLQVYVAPRADSRPKSFWQRGSAILRESASYLVWRLGVRS
jgi:uncharacterized SAM-binding protein YcdF (DUF218 family)